MSQKSALKDKVVLVVDDEPDVLETLVEMLDVCDVETASTYEEAKDALERMREIEKRGRYIERE